MLCLFIMYAHLVWVSNFVKCMNLFIAKCFNMYSMACICVIKTFYQKYQCNHKWSHLKTFNFQPPPQKLNTRNNNNHLNCLNKYLMWCHNRYSEGKKRHNGDEEEIAKAITTLQYVRLTISMMAMMVCTGFSYCTLCTFDSSTLATLYNNVRIYLALLCGELRLL